MRFDSIRPNRKRGVTGALVAPHVVDPHFVPELGERSGEDWWELDLERGTARLEDPPPGLESLGELPLDPMLGCFGVAPPQGQAISCATSGEHGGNMDYRGFRAGRDGRLPRLRRGRRSSTSATATRSRATARSSAPGSRSRWTSSSRSSC